MNNNILYYGVKSNLSEIVNLSSGPLNLFYENGCIRHIKLGETEIIRKIYFAIRDENWNTIEGILEDEVIDVGSNNFKLEFNSVHKTGAIDYTFRCRITGDENGTITFGIHGTSNSNFLRNRIGFCILHPIKECSGNKLEIVHPDGQSSDGIFPIEICPYQPFINIQKMIWRPNGQLETKISFEGDIFEMEDQRNWTDTSYKTYCTPLSLPYPSRIKSGETMHQEITLGIEKNSSERNIHSKKNIFKIDSESLNFKLPEIGFGPSNEKYKYSPKECDSLAGIDYDFIRVDIDMDQNIDEDFLISLNNAVKFKKSIHLGMHFGVDPIEQLKTKINLFDEYAITKCILFDKASKCTSDQLIESIMPILKTKYPEVQIGVGTNAYFTEFNRFTPSYEKADFAIYSINPQVHANDNLSLIENLNAQCDTVLSCKKLMKNLPVHVSPITLKPRFNPDAIGPQTITPPGKLPPQVDPRQMSLFGAGWTLGSIQNLTFGGADSITYYEPIGWKGIMQGDQPPLVDDQFNAFSGEVFPMYFIFYWITKMKKERPLFSKCSNPLLFSGLAFSTEEGISAILCSHSNKSISIDIDSEFKFRKIISLNADNITDFSRFPDKYLRKTTKLLSTPNIVTMEPYGLAFIN